MRSLVVALGGGALLALLSLPLAVSRFQSGAIFEGVAFAVLGSHAHTAPPCWSRS
jgi:hypothetical protein